MASTETFAIKVQQLLARLSRLTSVPEYFLSRDATLSDRYVAKLAGISGLLHPDQMSALAAVAKSIASAIENLARFTQPSIVQPLRRGLENVAYIDASYLGRGELTIVFPTTPGRELTLRRGFELCAQVVRKISSEQRVQNPLWLDALRRSGLIDSLNTVQAPQRGQLILTFSVPSTGDDRVAVGYLPELSDAFVAAEDALGLLDEAARTGDKGTRFGGDVVGLRSVSRDSGGTAVVESSSPSVAFTGKARRVSIPLNAAAYATAIKAHVEQRKVYVVARLRMRRRTLKVLDVIEFKLLE